MNSPQDTTRTGTRSRPAPQADSSSPAPPQRQPSPDSASRGQQSRQAGNPPDAVPGRQYQGTGVMNKSGRFGSSQGPEDLSGPGGTSRDDSGQNG
jgi:hypothetical protein